MVKTREALARKIERRLDLIAKTICARTIELPDWQVHEGDIPAKLAGIAEATWKPVRLKYCWQGQDSTIWFRRQVEIPGELVGDRLALYLSPGGEALVYLNGRPWQGLDENHKYITFTAEDEIVEVVLEVWSGQEPAEHAFADARLVVKNSEVEQIYTDFAVALDAARAMEGEKGEYFLREIDRALSLVDIHEIGPEYQHLPRLRQAGERLRERVYGNGTYRSRGKVALLGQSHLDVAWLWRIRETYRKSRRTFSTALRLMEEYPEYTFAQSTPALYAALKEHSPDIFAQVKKRVAEGRWELVGGMWVEPDGNMPSGESLVRQFVEGKKFLAEEFGVEPKIAWLPDTFGYSYSWPQIMKKAGIDYFMTTKMTWNQTNVMPHSTFWWQGIDGSRVGAHMVPILNAEVDAGTVVKAWDAMVDKDLTDATLLLYGYGDGGGGPIRKDVEWAKRLKDIPGLPQARLTSAVDFFQEFVKQPLQNAGDRAPVWNGELYLELHRGTFTSQARVKRANRKAEALYHNADFLATWSSLLGADYPQDELRIGWRGLLTNQFHDILPGSSIPEVYEDALQDYTAVFETGRDVVDRSLKHITDRIDTKTGGEGTPIVVFNTHSSSQTDVVQIDLPDQTDVVIRRPDGSPVPAQTVEVPPLGEVDPWEEVISGPQDEGQKRVAFTASVPPMGYAVYRAVPAKGTVAEPAAEGIEVEQKSECWRFENQFFTLEVTPSGQISRLFDKQANREVIAPGQQGNVLQAFEDKPNNWDAWDIDAHYQEKMWELTDGQAELIQQGPVFSVLRVRKKFRNSSIVQDIVMYSDLRRIDFRTWVDWHEQNTLLKVAFPCDVHTDRAVYDIAFGHIERSTYQNTSWDEARFEVPAHKWADLSEWGYGVSLLNDCKYGYDARENTLRLTLLKSATWPDPGQDQGRHFFTYSLYPHEGSWREAGTEEMAAALNNPLHPVLSTVHTGDLNETFSLISTNEPAVFIETVKRAEENDGVVVRLVERFGQRGKATLTAEFPVVEAIVCDLLEREEKKLPVSKNKVQLEYKPYEIITVKLKID